MALVTMLLRMTLRSALAASCASASSASERRVTHLPTPWAKWAKHGRRATTLRHLAWRHDAMTTRSVARLGC
eukprot:680544-Pyramimonas_sp.AAC.1